MLACSTNNSHKSNKFEDNINQILNPQILRDYDQLVVDNHHNLYFTIKKTTETYSTLYFLANKTTTPIKLSGLPANIIINDIKIDHQDDVYVLSNNAGLWKLPATTTIFQYIENVNELDILSFCFDQNDNVYFGTASVIGNYGTTYFLQHDSWQVKEINGLSIPISIIKIDQMNNVYLAPVTSINNNGPKAFVLKSGTTVIQAIADIKTNVNSIAIAPDNNVYFGLVNELYISKNHGISTQKLIEIDGDLGRILVTSNNSVYYEILKDNFTTLYKLDQEKQIYHSDEWWEINALVSDRANNLFFASESIFYMITNEQTMQETFYPHLKNMGYYINDIINKDDTIYFTNATGIWYYENN
ncbi:hypothetical protein [Spiroplasma eriocheiris]|uniref:Adhesin-like protein n=2 Tax=Spiroplasma eriocheiris TaxID=315358 RepID=A0A0H3XHA8_9MOLU|nr:hypothetical protein [Spiroplasma eriocheiris]ACY00395.1 adhesin-like protein [Spiroplasma eriocheiris CCTCC M 207170]AHF57165.1 putative adhesin like protein [Spiroplasma eriocheiris CCTCC M 207170]AKM53635.1 adhesin-like protein [Spiroplasma eriocheiris]